MNKVLGFLSLLALTFLSAHADEGMWLMQQLAQKYPEMKARGLELAEYDIYNPNGSSLKDAVVIFDQGCTGEVISSGGLVLTNHHCGYNAIQSLSSVEHNYLEDGYWAQSYAEELPAKDVTITYIDKIEDVTAFVRTELAKIKDPNSMDYLSPKYLATLATKLAPNPKRGTEVEVKAFYNGNKYLMFTKKIYRDIRLVGTPPSSIGKFGADTDNWAYPRHSGDFSIFRIYADAKGEPADYSPKNKPLKPKRWFNISTGGVQRGDFAMIMGFPGRTYHFFLPSEVEEWRTIDNNIRIKMRGIRQEVMLREMLADPKTNIMYAAKYASSQNGYKRAIGANWGIEVRGLGEDKRKQMQTLLDWAGQQGDKTYLEATKQIDAAIAERAELRRRLWYLREGILYGIEFSNALQPIANPMMLSDKFEEFFTSDYSPRVDALVAKALLKEYCAQIRPEHQPEAIREGVARHGSVEAYVDHIFATSVFTSRERFNKFISILPEGDLFKFTDDPMMQFAVSVRTEYARLIQELTRFDNPIDLARRTYVGGLMKLHGESNIWPDANSTLRFTFGSIKGYSPKDGVYYEPQTCLSGVMQKEDPTSWEFSVAPRLREIYQQKTYGRGNRWAIQTEDGAWRMPVNFCATTHTTGGNSGSPVLNARGELIGINFDRNWEGVGGDIQYLPDYQRSIICDIRYILMIIEEYGRCPRLLQEMNLH
ncbi:MAG: S46 family peptidase [Porphyromonadaceae bacterium]|nr:S46 family peptidase [Porphyromonadaceae bacterium]